MWLSALVAELLRKNQDKKGMAPTIEECYTFMGRYGMLDNIRAHSIVVEKIANLIARGHRDAGLEVSLGIVTAGALMHDIGKTICLKSGGDHAAVGEEICIQNHLMEIAGIVAEHVTLKNYRPDGKVIETEIVYYAEKRVKHDKVVSLEERLDDILRRYGRNKAHLHQLMKDNFDLCKMVEKKLFAKLPFSPEELAGMVE